MEIATRRFVLRDFTGEDLPSFAAYHSDPRSRIHYGPDDGAAGQAAELIHLFMSWALERPRRNFQLAVALRNGSLIGCAGLRMAEAEAGQAEIGVELAPEYWGRFGYAVEILACLMDFGFRELGLSLLVGRSIDANIRISRLAEAFGADPRECTTPEWMKARGWRQIEWHFGHDRWKELANRPLKAALRRSLTREHIRVSR